MSLSAIQIARPILGRGRATRVLAIRSAFVFVVYAAIAVVGALLTFFVTLLGWRGLGLFAIGAVASVAGLMYFSDVLLRLRKEVEEEHRSPEEVRMDVARSFHLQTKLAFWGAAATLGLVLLAPLFIVGFFGFTPLIGGGLFGYFVLRALQAFFGYRSSSAGRWISTRKP